jgi:predicted AlkP superfamily pyrophosphatase or phosphodiesterase
MFLENRFNFIYYPNIDVSAHVFGVNSDEWNKEVRKFEELVKKISELSNKKSHTVISADHGLTNIPKENRFHIAFQEDIDIYGDQRAVYINGSEKKIIEAFSNIPGQLINQIELDLLLPTPENKFVESLYPDFCFLVEDKNIIYPHHLKTELAGYHGGLSEEEIKIPIIEISNF